MEINADLYELLIAQGAPTDKAMAAAGGDHIYKNLATKDEIAGVKVEMAELRSEVKVEIAGVKTEIAGVKVEMAELRSEVKVEIAGVKVEIAGVKTEIANEFKGLYRYLWGMAAGIVTVILSGIGAGILVLNMLAS